jgi:L-histidine Nalpha-methyltransferase
MVAGVSPFGVAAEDVRTGLSRPQKELPSKYFYDEVGSALFEAITTLPEYGLTRADERLLRRHAAEIVDRLPSPLVVAELGSGSGKKARWILEALSRRQRTVYCPIEISASALARTRAELGELEFVHIVGFEKEYLEGLQAVAGAREDGGRLLVLFLGSSIGNFDRGPGTGFLRQVRRHLEPGDTLLLSTDLEKGVEQLILAYDDPLGVTAAFNRNLLARINRELGGDFVLERFRHHVRYDVAERRIEMHLRSTVAQKVTVRSAGLELSFSKDETIWTENCYKYNLNEVAEMAEQSGFECTAQWVDAEWPFAQSLFAVR